MISKTLFRGFPIAPEPLRRLGGKINVMKWNQYNTEF